VSRADPQTFRAALARFASGVTVVTARGADGADYGMTVSAFTSLSLDPPLVLACLDVTATLLPHLRQATSFGVSILAADQAAYSARFADQTVARFDGVPVTYAPEGPALIVGAAAHLVCRRVAEHAGGDHVIIVGEVQRAKALREAPLVYALRQYGCFAPSSAD